MLPRPKGAPGCPKRLEQGGFEFSLVHDKPAYAISKFFAGHGTFVVFKPKVRFPDGCLGLVERFSRRTGRWERVADLNVPRCDPAAAVVRGARRAGCSSGRAR